MGIFSGLGRKKGLTLLFDIGSASVGGVLFSHHDSGMPEIIFSAREPIPIQEEINVDRFLSITLKALESVAERIYNARLGAPSNILCFLSSPWYVSQTRTINFKKNTPFVFTNKLADELTAKEVKIFEEEHLAKYSAEGNLVRIVELKHIRTALNGYETENPLNQKAGELEMTIFVSMGGEQMLKKVEESIAGIFHYRQIKFASFALGAFTVVRDSEKEGKDFLLIDVGGEVTDVFMIKRNTLTESISFPLGQNFLIRGVAKGLGCTLAEAISFVSLYQDGHAEKSMAQKLELVIGQLKKEWQKKFQESMANLSKDISVPAKIYMTADRDLSGLFSEIIKTEQFSQYTLTESKFDLNILDTQFLHGLASFEENAVRDPALIIEAVYANRFLIKP